MLVTCVALTLRLPSPLRRLTLEGCRLPLNIGLLPLPVDPISTAMTCSLRSTGITPLHHYYEAVRPLGGASVLSASRFWPLVPFPLPSPSRFTSSVQEPE